MTTIGVILSGAGAMDGSEIHEATLTYLYLDTLNVTVKFFAPDAPQIDVINMISGSNMSESRNCLIEASRISRGNIQPLTDLNVDELDGVIFPGGYGAAKNLCSYASEGIQCSVNPDIDYLIRTLHEQKKPIGFICITPYIAAKVLPNLTITVGLNPQSIENAEQMGATVVQADYDDVVVDKKNNIYSTPAYMTDGSISQIALGIEKLVNYVVEAVPIQEPISAA